MSNRRLLAIVLSAATVASAAWVIEAQPPAPPSSEEATAAAEELEEEGRDRPRAEAQAIGGGLGAPSPRVSTKQPGDTPEASSASDISKAEMTLGLAAFLVALTTFVFGVAMTIVGYLSFTKYREAEQRLDQKFTELEEARNKVARLDSELDVKIKDVREELARQEKMAFENRRFFEAVRGELFELLVGIVENVRYALGAGKEQELKALIGEAEACLNLFSPDAEEVTRALWRLEKIGSANCISPLNTVVEDSNVDPEMRLRAQHALHVVTGRLEKTRDSTPEPSVGGQAQRSAEDQAGEAPDEPTPGDDAPASRS